jgi:hypothetical protein
VRVHDGVCRGGGGQAQGLMHLQRREVPGRAELSAHMSVPQAAPEYQAWGRITRFFESTRLAFARERSLWRSLEIAEGQRVELSAPVGQGEYRVWLDAHLATIEDEGILLASVLIHSYALAEASALARLGLTPDQQGGIEDWGTKLLATTGQAWTDVIDGLAGALEVSVVERLRPRRSPGTLEGRESPRCRGRSLLRCWRRHRAEVRGRTSVCHRLLSLMRNRGVR